MEDFILGPLQTKWLESLEAHPERQIANVLGQKHPDGKYSACCLGEAGIIADVCEWNDEGTLRVKGHLNAIHTLNHEAYRAIGLYDDAGRPTDGASPNLTLYSMNDAGVSWPNIAKAIRENPRRYFTESK